MKLYNTLHRRLEDFEPLHAGSVKLYTCGPTVYDYAHIGNLRSFIFDDTLRRALSASGYEVDHIMNITDVGHLASDADEGEDKLEKGAVREGKTVQDVSKFYTDAFLHDMKELNVLAPNAYHGRSDGYARATDFIPEQLDIVERLMDKGIAYQTDQAIYFDVSKLKDYGKLAGQRLSDKEVGARAEVVTDSHKRNPQDFAVWFFTVGRFSGHALHWSSPWGDGFPGWHLECSAIIHATLGEPIDIHTGGVDHIGTHHTNEIAQTEAAYGVELARYWLHNEHLLVGGHKMSKSLGNFYTLSDITSKSYDPLAFRLLILQSHYRTQSEFSLDALTAAQNRLKDLQAWADLRHQPNAETMPESLDDLFRDTRQAMRAAMANDLNTPEALSALGKLVSHMQTIAIPGVEGKYTDGTLQLIDDLFGLNLSNRPDISSEQKQLMKSRQRARDTKDWAEADRLRDQLTEHGLGVRDMSFGQQWYRL